MISFVDQGFSVCVCSKALLFLSLTVHSFHIWCRSHLMTVDIKELSPFLLLNMRHNSPSHKGHASRLKVTPISQSEADCVPLKWEQFYEDICLVFH